MSIDLSLERLRKLVSHLPSYTRPTLHIAGTNGKGSVSALLTSILLNSDPPVSVGRFNSPHLVSIYDSITLNNVPVSPSLYNVIRAEVEDADKKHETKLSSFEIVTLVALQVFEKFHVDIVVLEVGMGGRLDATNIVSDETIAVSALTAVDLDHQSFLGGTVIKIAEEKAGTARTGRPFVLGTQKHEGVHEAVQGVLERLGSVKLVNAVKVQLREWDVALDGPKPLPFSLISNGDTFHPPPPQSVTVSLSYFSDPVNALLPLQGAHQLDNLGTALTVINELLDFQPLPSVVPLNLGQRITVQTIARGIKNVNWPGRLSFHTIYVSSGLSTGKYVTAQSAPMLRTSSPDQTIYPLVILADGAHNAGSAETLGQYVTHLLELNIESMLASDKYSRTTSIDIDITYILALSQSPPKTPLQTLSPILPPKLPAASAMTINLNVATALLRFTQPEGMPWINSVPPEEIEDVVRSLVPDADIFTIRDSPLSAFSAPGIKNFVLEAALQWVAQRRDRDEEQCKEVPARLELVVLAGSLYLVADFYRILNFDPAPCT